MRDKRARQWRERWHGHAMGEHPRWEAKYGQFGRHDLRPPLSATARLLIPVVLSLLIQLPANLFWLAQSRGLAAMASVVLAIAGPLALLLVRRFPGPVVAAVSLAACVDFIVSERIQGTPFLALAFAIVLSIARGARIWAWISVGAGWTGTVTIGLVLGLDWHPARIALTTLGILVTFGIGEGFRTRSQNLAEFRRAQVQRRQTEVQAERVRIARELHDVLAHSLSQINVQAGVGLHLMQKQPEKAAEALASIKDSSKIALDEVRSVLGILRAEDGQDPSAPLVPEPDLSRLAGLVASVTSQGVTVTLDCSVTGGPQATQLAIYRIVQESLTNVVRHAKASSAQVTVSTAGTDYLLSVGDDGIGLAGESGSGRGLLGMRERAELLGGSLDVSASASGGTLITARIPMTDTERSGTP